ncbi:MAG TPA: UrcA family protein [Allosphingosinicella sp.]|jgi:UrcA family protein
MKRTLMLAALAAASSITPALAQDAAGDSVQVVSFADLDLSRKADVRKLDRRIALAVSEVCGAGSNADPAGKNDIRRCRAELTAHLTAERERAIASKARPDILVAARER